jgi:glycyl-tRNA synthetase beta chain
MNDLLLEIGSEEIPAGYIQPALDSMVSGLRQRLEKARLQHGKVHSHGTPRRLSVIVEQLAEKQESITTEVVGPPESVAFDDGGQPTMAARKFAEKVSLAVDQLAVKETPKGRYLCAEISERGEAAADLLAEILPAVILATPFPKKMRWANLDIEFARPIHTIIALLGNQVVDFELGNLRSGRQTAGHYFMAPAMIDIQSSATYVEQLRQTHVLVDIAERRRCLLDEIERVAKQIGGRILEDPELVDINNNLVENPVAIAGKFDEEFLEVPDEVLINAMREHQKYFSVVDDQNRLLPYFISVNNTHARDMDLVARGHERVIRARLADAQFFYRGDLEVTNDQRVEKLKGVLFQAQLGTMYEKTERLGQMAEYLAGQVSGETADERLMQQAGRAARLSKSDLVSQVVGEFPKLQGVMGRVYAAIEKEPADVAAAVEEHYRPVYSGAALPQTLTGALVSIADKIDSICGCFSVGLVPTGASDPYALRRQGIGMVQITVDKGLSFSLTALIGKSLSLYETPGATDTASLTDQIYTFIRNRIERLLVEDGFAKDVVAAVVDVSIDNINDVWKRVAALDRLRNEPDFQPLAAAFKRVGNILKKAAESGEATQPGAVDESLFEHDSETALYRAYRDVEGSVQRSLKDNAFERALRDIASLRDRVDAFFENVMVMTDQPSVRRNRLALLAGIAALFENLADFSKITT